MAISSINIQPSSGNAIIHNERIFDVAYALKNDDVNEYHRIASISETRKAIYEDYKLHHGRKLNTKATPIREAVVNLNENHTMEDLKKLSEMLDKDYQMKVLHIAIHRDEGHIDTDGKEKINYHAHIVFHNYDFDKHITIKRDKDVMRKLQTDVAKNLGMERGLENSQAVRLDHRQYKRAMQEVEIKTKEIKKENEVLKEELKEVKQENTELKYNFKEMQKTITSLENLTVEQKKELHSLNSKVKNEKAEYEELLKKIDTLTVEKEHLKSVVELKEVEILDLEPYKDLYFSQEHDLNALQEQNKVLVEKVSILEEKINSSPNMEQYEHYKKQHEVRGKIIFEEAKQIPELEPEKTNLRKLVDYFKNTINDLKTKVSTLFKRNQELESENKALKDELYEYKKEKLINEGKNNPHEAIRKTLENAGLTGYSKFEEMQKKDLKEIIENNRRKAEKEKLEQEQQRQQIQRNQGLQR
jgi:hypothetical protein